MQFKFWAKYYVYLLFSKGEIHTSSCSFYFFLTEFYNRSPLICGLTKDVSHMIAKICNRIMKNYEKQTVLQYNLHSFSNVHHS